tara:strand:+ start:346 stop:645 length:300 start_codon:yes stop_codon:yes gene_type:complete
LITYKSNLLYYEIPRPKKEFEINKKLTITKKHIPIQEMEFKNNPYLFEGDTNLLFIVSIAIHANIGAVKKLPVIAVKTNSFTPISPDFAIRIIAKDANI